MPGYRSQFVLHLFQRCNAPEDKVVVEEGSVVGGSNMKHERLLASRKTLGATGAWTAKSLIQRSTRLID